MPAPESQRNRTGVSIAASGKVKFLITIYTNTKLCINYLVFDKTAPPDTPTYLQPTSRFDQGRRQSYSFGTSGQYAFHVNASVSNDYDLPVCDPMQRFLLILIQKLV